MVDSAVLMRSLVLLSITLYEECSMGRIKVAGFIFPGTFLERKLVAHQCGEALRP